jgi:hypothetical protein
MSSFSLFCLSSLSYTFPLHPFLGTKNARDLRRMLRPGRTVAVWRGHTVIFICIDIRATNITVGSDMSGQVLEDI